MKHILFSTKPWGTQFLLFTRLFVGILFIRHGLGIFNVEGIGDNEAVWLRDVNFPFPKFSAFLGKACELLGGILLILGLFVRIMTLPVVFTMFVICFIIGNGDILTERAYPFLLLSYYLTIFFTGPGKWSLDYLLFDKEKRSSELMKPVHSNAATNENA